MGTISVTLPADGETMDAADVNNPINTIVTAVNGNLDSNNISAGGITPANLVSGTGTSWAWTSWTPTWANLTIGNAVQTCKYVQIGKTVFFRVAVTLGTTSSVGTNPTFTLPVTSVSLDDSHMIGVHTAVDNGTGVVQGFVAWKSTTTALPATTSTTYFAGLSATGPFTWTTGDKLLASGSYEVA